MSSNKSSKTLNIASLAVPLTIFLVLLTLAVTLWFIGSRSLDMDLDKIGNGKPALVLIYDKELVASGEQTDAIFAVREQLEAQVQLLIADTGTPRGRALMEQHQAGVINLLLFDGQGNLLAKRQGPLGSRGVLELVALLQYQAQ